MPLDCTPILLYSFRLEALLGEVDGLGDEERPCFPLSLWSILSISQMKILRCLLVQFPEDDEFVQSIDELSRKCFWRLLRVFLSFSCSPGDLRAEPIDSGFAKAPDVRVATMIVFEGDGMSEPVRHRSSSRIWENVRDVRMCFSSSSKRTTE